MNRFLTHLARSGGTAALCPRAVAAGTSAQTLELGILIETSIRTPPAPGVGGRCSLLETLRRHKTPSRECLRNLEAGVWEAGLPQTEHQKNVYCSWLQSSGACGGPSALELRRFMALSSGSLSGQRLRARLGGELSQGPQVTSGHSTPLPTCAHSLPFSPSSEEPCPSSSTTPQSAYGETEALR